MAAIPKRLRKLARGFFYLRWVRNVLIRVPIVSGIYPPWERTHPIDREYGIDTSGFVYVDKITSNWKMRELINPYGGSQPSVVRKALEALGNVEEFTFVDLGCGKGRATVVATEFPFRAVMGVELSGELAAVARKNAAIVAEKFPHRQKIEIVEADAVNFPLPDGKLVLFMYHPFGTELLHRFIANLEDRLHHGVTDLFVIYYNPVHSAVFDASPALKRSYAEFVECNPEDVDYGPTDRDRVIMWHSQPVNRFALSH